MIDHTPSSRSSRNAPKDMSSTAGNIIIASPSAEPLKVIPQSAVDSEKSHQFGEKVKLARLNLNDEPPNNGITQPPETVEGSNPLSVAQQTEAHTTPLEETSLPGQQQVSVLLKSTTEHQTAAEIAATPDNVSVPATVINDTPDSTVAQPLIEQAPLQTSKTDILQQATDSSDSDAPLTTGQAQALAQPTQAIPLEKQQITAAHQHTLTEQPSRLFGRPVATQTTVEPAAANGVVSLTEQLPASGRATVADQIPVNRALNPDSAIVKQLPAGESPTPTPYIRISNQNSFEQVLPPAGQNPKEIPSGENPALMVAVPVSAQTLKDGQALPAFKEPFSSNAQTTKVKRFAEMEALLQANSTARLLRTNSDSSLSNPAAFLQTQFNPAPLDQPREGLLAKTELTAGINPNTTSARVLPAVPAFAGDNIRMMLQQGLNRATVMLHPADLGALKINLEIQSDQLHVQITATQGATREALEQALPKIRSQLINDGFTDVNIDLSSDQENHSQQHSEQACNFRHDDSIEHFAQPNGIPKELSISDTGGFQTPPVSKHRIDLFA